MIVRVVFCSLALLVAACASPSQAQQQPQTSVAAAPETTDAPEHAEDPPACPDGSPCEADQPPAEPSQPTAQEEDARPSRSISRDRLPRCPNPADPRCTPRGEVVPRQTRPPE